MPFHSIGDLAGGLMLSQASVQAKRNMSRFSQELTTGLTSDSRGALRNDQAKAMGWERTISSAKVREKTLAEALVQARARQLALESVSETSLNLANDVTLSLTANSEPMVQDMSKAAVRALDETLSKLNTNVSGHSVFAGAQTKGPAVAQASQILSAVKSAISGAVTASDVITGVQNWFEDPVNGFQSVGYLGSDQNGPLTRISDRRSFQTGARADDPAIKSVVQQLVLTALAADQDVALSSGGARTVLEHSAVELRNAQSKVTQLQAGLGYAEAQIEQAKTQASAEITSAERFRLSVLSVDPYESATKLQETELQLEKIYALTARASQMNLLEFMR